MHSVLAQGFSPLALPLVITYYNGIPACAVAAVFINLFASHTPSKKGRFGAAVIAVLPLFSLFFWEAAGTEMRSYEHRSIWNDARDHWPFWGMTAVAVLGGGLAYYRRREPPDPSRPPWFRQTPRQNCDRLCRGFFAWLYR